MKKIEDYKKEYNSIEVPDELEFLTKKTIKQAKKNIQEEDRMNSKMNIFKKASIVAVMGVSLVLVGVNTSHNIANAFSEVPVVSNIIEVITFRNYDYDNENYVADIDVPNVEGLDNKELENSLNQKYIAEGKELFDNFTNEVKSMEEIEGGGHLAVTAGYDIVTDTDNIIVIKRFEDKVIASSDSKVQYDVIDKAKEIVITLPSLFKDDTYINIISDDIKEQMKEQMKEDESIVYFFEEDGFESIDKNQNFYINEDNKLIISFDKYEVAPGYMGVVEFEISTELIKNSLVGDNYIK